MRRLHELDGLRGLAAMAVVVAHFNYDIFKGTEVAAYIVLMHHYSLANLAVAFFYVLSAFLLTTLALRELRETGCFNRRHFLLRRVARIWPLYWMAVAVSAIISINEVAAMGANAETWPWLRDHLWIYALFLGNWSLALAVPEWHTDRSPPGLSVLWSIAVEEQFYVVYVLLAGLVLVSGRRLTITVILATLLGMTYRAWHLTQYQPQQKLYGMYYATPSFLEMFAFGAAAAWLLADEGRVGQWVRNALRSPFAILAILWLLWTVADRWGGGWNHPLGPVAGYPTAALAMSLLVGWSVVNRDSLSIRWTLGGWPFRILGILSFGVYVWHPSAQGIVREQLPMLDAGGMLAAYLCVTVMLAAVTYVLIERPFIRLAHRGFRTRKAAPGPDQVRGHKCTGCAALKRESNSRAADTGQPIYH